MSKIRINELARELEVKPNVILDLLPELGVTDKKTHSSSLDDDVALEVRRYAVSGNAATAPIRLEDSADAAAQSTEPAHPARRDRRAPGARAARSPHTRSLPG